MGYCYLALTRDDARAKQSNDLTHYTLYNILIALVQFKCYLNEMSIGSRLKKSNVKQEILVPQKFKSGEGSRELASGQGGLFTFLPGCHFTIFKFLSANIVGKCNQASHKAVITE